MGPVLDRKSLTKLLSTLREFVAPLADTARGNVIETGHATEALDRLIADLRDLDRNIVPELLKPKKPKGIGNRPPVSASQIETRRAATAVVRALRKMGKSGDVVYKRVATVMNASGFGYSSTRKGTKSTKITAGQVKAWSKPSAQK